MRYPSLILFALVFCTNAKSQQMQPLYLGETSWHKTAQQQGIERLPASATVYPVTKTVVHNNQPGIYQRRVDPGTVTLHNGPTVPVVQQITITGKKLPAPQVLSAPPLQTRDNVSFNISYSDKKHGFPANAVMDFAEDDEHNIWIASEKGLIRYDGYHYYLYKQELTIPDISDCSLAFDQQKRLWMASENGIFFIRNDSIFSLHSNETDLSAIACKSVMIDRFQRAWISTKNNGVLCIEGSSMKVYDRRCGLPNNYFESVYLDKKGNLYMACRSFGIVLIEPNRMRMFFGRNKTMKYPIFLSFYEDEDGIWAGSFLSGIMRLGTKDTVQYSPGGHFSEAVYDIKKAPEGIWFSCYGSGLAYFNKKDFTVLNDRNGLLNNFPYKLFEDNFQNLWVGNISGFSRVNENCFYLRDFSNPAVGSTTTILPDKKKGGNWMTTFGQNLIYQKGNEATVYSYKTPAGIPLFNYINAGVLDNDGTIWMGSYGEGIAHVNEQSFTLFRYSNFTDHGIIQSIKMDGKNRIWFCPTRFGAIVYDKHQFWHYTKNSGLLSNDVIRLFLDADKNVQCSFADGFQRFTDAGIETLHVGNKAFNDQVNDVLNLDDGTSLWATNSSGLLILKNGKVYQLNTKMGLGSDNIRSVIRDSTGRIWLSTERTIESFVLKDLSVAGHTVFDEANGSYILDAGNVFLDSTGLPYWVDGAKKLVFNNNMLHYKNNRPLFSFKEVSLNDNILSPAHKISMYPDEKIKLDYKTIYWGRENNLRLTYLLISNRNDTTERPAQNTGSIIISDVLPGNYRLLLKGTDTRGVYYSGAVNIAVNNFWYNTWLFRILMAAFILSGIVYYFRQKSRQQLLINETLKRKVSEQTAIIENEKNTLLLSYQTIESQNREKDVLIDEINHRVKNNLEFIAAMMEMQMNNQHSTEAIQALLGTNRRIKAMSLVHELLYNKKDQQGLSMRAYIHELVNSLKEMAIDESSPVDIEMEVDDVVVDSKTALSLGMIISELVSNSFKHAFSNVPEPRVSILLKNDQQTGLFHLVVSDNGNGYRQHQQQASSGGLGTRLVDIFSRQLEGKSTIQTTGQFIYQLEFKTSET
ncbi:MAG: hypothetical protein JWN76_3226 [Chitinophagaceae bacterium]|nr:hypothetical protein [Chitinophagaceae bacterium]